MITKAICQKEVLKALTKRNMVEMSSGSGQDFCDAIGEAVFEILKQVNTVYMLHKHECTAPGSASLVPDTPIVGG